MTIKTRADILDTAKRFVTTDRAADHGDMEDNFGRIAAYWSAHLDTPVSATDVAVMMNLLKMARIKGNPGHMDNWVDASGYAACGGEIAAGRAAAGFEGPDPEELKQARIEECLHMLRLGHSPGALEPLFSVGCVREAKRFYDAERPPAPSAEGARAVTALDLFREALNASGVDPWRDGVRWDMNHDTLKSVFGGDGHSSCYLLGLPVVTVPELDGGIAHLIGSDGSVAAVVRLPVI